MEDGTVTISQTDCLQLYDDQSTASSDESFDLGDCSSSYKV